MNITACAVAPILGLGACTVGEPSTLDTPAEVYVIPERGYGGFDGVHAFLLPLATSLGGDVQWHVDPARASIERWQPPAEASGTPLVTWALMAVKASGSLVVDVTTSQASASLALEITAYDPADIALGEQRYRAPADPQRPGRVACASCHAQPGGHDHSAIHTMFWSDGDLLSAITTGRYTDDTKLEVDHAFAVTEAEARGIVGYLRSLPPQR